MSNLWGGRFAGEMDSLVKRLNDSLPFDRRLWREDIDGSIAHAIMLGEQGIIPSEDANRLVAELRAIRTDLGSGDARLPEDAEDIHSAIEGLLRERMGPVAGKLHTGRSRNDQVATDTRLWLRGALDDLRDRIETLQGEIVAVAEKEIDTILPGYTHLQHAQPVRLAHHLLAYFWMFERDRERLTDVRKRLNCLPLGAGALAGTPFPIRRERVAELLGFDSVIENSMDAVADRDFAVEFLAASSLVAVHLSRLAEEIILWSSPEFHFVELDDSVTTGSSIMPQKKNPDVAELARGKAGRVIGHLVSTLITLKGLPLTYNKDMQEDKEPLFDTVDTLTMLIPPFAKMIATARWDRDRMQLAMVRDFSTATDLADFLVMQGLPFRDAHHIVGRIVRDCIDRNVGLEDLSVEDLAKIDIRFDGAPQGITSVLASVESRRVRGGVARDAVSHQLSLARRRLE